MTSGRKKIAPGHIGQVGAPANMHPWTPSEKILHTPTDAAWTVHYFDKRLNRSEQSREFTSEPGAMQQACDLMKQGMRVDNVRGPNGRRIGGAELVAWCKANRTPEKPQDPPKVNT